MTGIVAVSTGIVAVAVDTVDGGGAHAGGLGQGRQMLPTVESKGGVGTSHLFVFSYSLACSTRSQSHRTGDCWSSLLCYNVGTNWDKHTAIYKNENKYTCTA